MFHDNITVIRYTGWVFRGTLTLGIWIVFVVKEDFVMFGFVTSRFRFIHFIISLAGLKNKFRYVYLVIGCKGLLCIVVPVVLYKANRKSSVQVITSWEACQQMSILHTVQQTLQNLQRRSFVEVSVTYSGTIVHHVPQHLQVACAGHFTDFMHAVMM